MKRVYKKVLVVLLLVMFIAQGVIVPGSAEEAGWKKFDDVKLTMLNCWNGTGGAFPEDWYGNDIATAIREKIGVTIEVEGLMMSELEKLNLIFASGDLPDIINAPYFGGNDGHTAVIKKAAIEGMLLPVDDYIFDLPNISMAFDVGVISQQFLENDVEPPEFDGKHYVLPQQTPGNANNVNNWTDSLFARGDILEALGVDPASIDSAEKFYDVLVQVRDGGFTDVNGNSVIPLSSFHDGWYWPHIGASFHDLHLTEYRQVDGKFTNYRFTQEYMDETLFFRKLVQENLLDKECFTTTDELAFQKFGNGTAFAGGAHYSYVIQATKESGLYNEHPEMRYVAIGPFKLKDGNPWYQYEPVGRSGSPALIFPTSCSNLEAALTYIDFANSREGTILMNYGFEGDTLQFVDGSPLFTDDIRERKKNSDPNIEFELRDKGLKYWGLFFLADTRNDWIKLDPETVTPEVEEYKRIRPVQQISGYPLSAKEGEFPEISAYRAIFTDTNDYRERAYFAETDEQAVALIEEMRNYILTAEGGVYTQFMEWLDEIYTTRDDFIY